jgi:hypothetical protein
VLLVFALGGPLADGIIAGARHRTFQPRCSLSSPAYVLTAASAWGRSAYWSALAVSQLIGWALLALACALVPYTWQDRKRAGASTTRSWAYVCATITNQSGILTSHTFSVSTTVTIPAKAGTNAAPGSSGFQVRIPPRQTGMAVAAAAAAALSTGANLLALCWFGMWMGLTSRSANLATLKTILFVQVIPWFVIAFTTTLVVGLMLSGLAFRASPTQPASFFAWLPLLSALLAAVLAVAKDIGFILWSRKKLYSCLREQAALNLGQPRFATPPPVSLSGPPPPIIAAVQ